MNLLVHQNESTTFYTLPLYRNETFHHLSKSVCHLNESINVLFYSDSLFQQLVSKVLGARDAAEVLEDIYLTADETPSGYINYRPWTSNLPKKAAKFAGIHFKVQKLKLEQILWIHVSTNFLEILEFDIYYFS